MEILMTAILHSSAALRVAVCLCACTSISTWLAPAVAAEPNAEFAVSAAQTKTLGVTLFKLEQPGAMAGMAYAANVVLPPGQVQVTLFTKKPWPSLQRESKRVEAGDNPVQTGDGTQASWTINL